jgi:hypothetical protein
MASNFSNYFFKAYTDKPSFDELVYGFNGTSGSTRIDGSKQAVGSIEFDAFTYLKGDIENTGFSITGSVDGGSTHFSEVKIDVDASYTSGEIYISSSQEVWLRIKAGAPTLLTKSELISFLEQAVNYHRLSVVDTGPQIIAEASGSFLVLTQVNAGPIGNECDVQGLSSPLPNVTYQTFEGGAAIGGGPYSVNWMPSTGTFEASGERIVDSYVLSPKRHGNLSDVFYSPPERFTYFPLATPPVSRNISATDANSSNTDIHSRIFTRYTDGLTSENYDIDVSIFTSL